MLRRLPWTLAIVGLLALIAAPPCEAQTESETEELKKEIQALKEGQEKIRKDLADIKRLLATMQKGGADKPLNVVLDLEGSSFLGSENAKVTLIEASDYQ